MIFRKCVFVNLSMFLKYLGNKINIVFHYLWDRQQFIR